MNWRSKYRVIDQHGKEFIGYVRNLDYLKPTLGIEVVSDVVEDLEADLGFAPSSTASVTIVFNPIRMELVDAGTPFSLPEPRTAEEAINNPYPETTNPIRGQNYPLQ